jgi:hypothetical protein
MFSSWREHAFPGSSQRMLRQMRDHHAMHARYAKADDLQRKH